MNQSISSRPNCIRSRYNFQCGVCASMIQTGDFIFPFIPLVMGKEEGKNNNKFSKLDTNLTSKKNIQDKNEKRIFWAHESCQSYFGPLGVPPPPSCRHWKRLGRCPMHEAGMCAFRHDAIDCAVDKLKAPKKRMGGKRAIIHNRHKNASFRIFLMQTYGLDYLKGEGFIIDVAGGKGELSWELINLVGCEEVVVIDPRPLSLQKSEQKWRKGLYEPLRTGPVFKKWQPAVMSGDSRNKKPKYPRHLRCFFDAKKFSHILLQNKKTVEIFGSRYDHEPKNSSEIEFIDASKWLLNERIRAKDVQWTTKGLQNHENEDDNHEDYYDEPIEMEKSNDKGEGLSCINEVTNVYEARDIFERCKLIVGLHPDQAVGEIVEFANTWNIPWCVVPCCVYSDFFPKRRLKDGTKVTSYDHLMKWLCEKGGENNKTETATLDTLDGKNKVIYTMPAQK